MAEGPVVYLNATKRRLRRGPIVVGLVGLGLLASFWWTFAQPVDADEVAVRQVYFGPSKGVQAEPLHGPGLHLVVPMFERLHRFPRDVQSLHFNDRAEGGEDIWDPDASSTPSIRIQTSEGYQVTVDVSVLFRIVDPYTVLTKVGEGRLFESQVVQRLADKILRQKLGSLNAEEFYDDDVRIAMVEAARAQLSEECAAWGIQVVNVLLREYVYDQRYQEAIEGRKIQDQRVFKNQAESVSATRGAERDRVVAEGKARIEVERERGRAEVSGIAAEADLYARTKVAEGDLLVALAEARGTELENRALQAGGAQAVVGLEMAKALTGVEVIVVSTTGPGAMNPLDLDSLVEGF